MLGSQKKTWLIASFVFLALITPFENLTAECRTIVVCDDDRSGCHYANMKEVALGEADDTAIDPIDLVPCQ
jgi:hypothetical protein